MVGMRLGAGGCGSGAGDGLGAGGVATGCAGAPSVRASVIAVSIRIPLTALKDSFSVVLPKPTNRGNRHHHPARVAGLRVKRTQLTTRTHMRPMTGETNRE